MQKRNAEDQKEFEKKIVDKYNAYQFKENIILEECK